MAARRLNTNQIVNKLDELDDGFRVPEYEWEKREQLGHVRERRGGGSLNLGVVRRQEQLTEEIRIYTDPPIERADGYSNRDTGEKNIKFVVQFFGLERSSCNFRGLLQNKRDFCSFY
jgi:hypothetical protein